MELSLYVESLRDHMALAAESGGDEARATAERLVGQLESAVRLVLLEALSAAADEITGELAPGAVEVRLRGTDPTFVVTPPPGEDSFAETEPESRAPVLSGAAETDEGGTARLNLRLPESLKTRVEEAARVEGLSLNAWLVRAAAAALGPGGQPQRRTASGGVHYSGWVR
jgi:hypothetical protein